MTTADSAGTAPSPSSTPLIDAASLATRLAEPDARARTDTTIRLVDVRWYLGGKRGADEYAKGHLPGAAFLDLDRDLSADVGPGRHPIPSAEKLTATMRHAGVSSTTHVIAYDDAAGSIAARVWWLLRHFGHAKVSVLDGGIAAWLAGGHALSTDVPTFPVGDFVAKAPRERGAPRVVDKHHVRARAGAPGTLVLDARARERYRGDLEPVDARPGHVPFAKNAPWSENAKDGRMLSAAELRARYDALGAAAAEEILVYCGSGVTACHDLLALEIAGIEDAKLYEGSWSDWAADPSLPAAKGEEPGAR
jgi:thiosulfate/3-mercaptopyruvate sulfurtransferase